VDGGLLRDEDWRPLDGEICRVRAFTPLAGRVEGTKVKSFTRGLPYASIEIESPALPEATTGYITNKLDFQHLWQAFNIRGVGDEEEVIVDPGGEPGWTLRLDVDDEPVAFCPDCDQREFGSS
jgi:hypothetical protein